MTITRDKLLDIDDLAQFIRSIDGNHSLGAGALAEKICERFAALLSEAQEGEPVGKLFLGGVTDNELDDNDVELSMKSVERLQAEMVKQGHVYGVWLDLYTTPPSSDQVWNDAAEWLRNNYQEYVNIADLCDAMRKHSSQASQLSSMLSVIASGSTVSILFDSPELAQSFADRTNEAARAVNSPSQAQEPKCPTCRGNDADMPCAYPSKGMSGCLQDKRMAASGAVGEQSAQVTDEPIALALAALKANHEHHQNYDDYGGYPESELCEQNTKAIAALSRVQAAPDAELLKDGKLFRKLLSYQYWHRQELVRHDDVRTAIDKAPNKYRAAAPSVNEQGEGKS